MAPNTGQGANCAIEDAAGLLNVLNDDCFRSEDCSRKPCGEDIDLKLQHFTKMRVERVSKVYKSARSLVRIHARDGLFMKLLGRYVIPNSGDVSADKSSETVVGAPALDFFPLPERSGPGWTSFKRQPKGTVPFWRMVVVLSLLAVSMRWMWGGGK